MSQALEDLCPVVRPAVEKLLALAQETLAFDMCVVDTLRTPAEQDANIRAGVSWTRNSRHLAQPVCGLAHAADLAPKHLMRLKNWAPKHSDWLRLGELGESLEFLWGGRWLHRDCPHFEMRTAHERKV